MVVFLSPDTAFLLSDAHVTAMLQCLEAVEQNNPRLLAQIDASMVKGARNYLSVLASGTSPGCNPREPTTSSLRHLSTEKLLFIKILGEEEGGSEVKSLGLGLFEMGRVCFFRPFFKSSV